MAGELGVVFKVVEPVKTFLFDSVRDYVVYIGRCEDNLCTLRKTLSDVCDKKDDISKKVKQGEDKLEEITREAASWLKDVRLLAGDEELKSLMYKDVETAKFVVRLIGKKDLKKLVRKDGEMQKLVVNVMNELKEEMEQCEEEMREIAKADYKMVAEVVVEVMKDTTDEFKKLVKKDKKMAVIATKMLKDRDLDKLTKDDKEMEDIVREVGNISDEDLGQNDGAEVKEESSGVLVKVPEVAVDQNTVREAATKLLIPLGNLLTPLAKLVDDSNFKNAVPEAEGVKLGLDVIDGLLLKNRGLKKETREKTRQHSSCFCCAVDLTYFHRLYKMSIAAETMAKHIEADIIKKCPGNPVTVPIRSADMKPTPTQFLKGLQSRDKLLLQILKILEDDQVDVVGLVGMGGCGKTTLAKEVAKKRVNDIFKIKVMVEISDSPDIGRIQEAIAESIGLPLHDVQSISQRAIKLFNRLTLEKEKSILIILDNIWAKLCLDEVGIPATCKLLLTTRDKEVCRLMGVGDSNILQVGLLNATETKDLFRSQAGDKVDSADYKNVTDRLLSKCGGLPLSIVVMANGLKNKGLSDWQIFADELEKPISSQQVSGDHRESYSILATSYKFLESMEKRMFFLLSCLFPLGSMVPIKELMRLGIGLDLFQHVNSLSEAMNQANKWADELISSSMLLKADSEEHFEIHDVVRAFGISFAAKDDGHMFLVDAIPRWMNKKTLRKYTAMSLFSGNDYARLNGIECYKLQILLLKGNLLLDIPNYFFGGMPNLEVLVLSYVNFQPRLPESIGKLEKLRTLYLESCKLGDIKIIGELVNLSVLCLCDSYMEELPDELGELRNLRLLDLTGCTGTFQPFATNILAKLSELEGLYMFDSFENHLQSSEIGGVSTAPHATDFNKLQYLNELEMHIWNAEQLSIDGQFVKNLDKFRICVKYGKLRFSDRLEYESFNCLLDIDHIDMGEAVEKRSLKALLKKADWLRLSKSKNFKDVVTELDNGGFKNLRYLEVTKCEDVIFIVKSYGARDESLIFPSLESLELCDLPKLKGVCNNEAPPRTFSNLKHLSMRHLSDLEYVLPFAWVPHKLTDIEVANCGSLNYIFVENVTDDVRPDVNEVTTGIELPFLESLELNQLDHLINLLGPRNLVSSSVGLEGNQAFFNPRIIFSSLKRFVLVNCKRIVKLWDKGPDNSSFQNLKKIWIDRCGEISSLGPPTLFSALVQLEFLAIECCKSMHEVITTEATEDLEICDQVVIFHELKDLIIRESSNLQCFYGGKYKLKFPKLTTLQLHNLEKMNRFAGPENSPALFHEEMDFSCLEKLVVTHVNDGVMGLWNWNLERESNALLNRVPMLRRLTLGKTERLRLIPPIICEHLSFLQLKKFNDEVLLSSGKESSVWTCSQLPKLVELCVEDCNLLKEFLMKEDFNTIAAATFCEQLKRIELINLPRLKLLPWHMFKSLCSLYLKSLSWEHLLSADAFVRLQGSLQQLEVLSINDCGNMRVIIQNDMERDSDLVIVFPRLRVIHLSSSSILSFSSTGNATLRLPLLEKIDLVNCKEMHHFWSGPIIAPRLTEVDVIGSNSMQCLLVGNPSHTVELQSLQRVWLKDCSAMLSFSSGPLVLPKLQNVTILNCSRLLWFMSHNPNNDASLKLPSLAYVSIHECPNMQSFSTGSVSTPDLCHVACEKDAYTMLQFDLNLNHILRSRHDIDYSEELNTMFHGSD